MKRHNIDFAEIFKDYDKEIPIVIHNFPDPDAISSALGMTQLLKLNNLKPGDIYFSGEVSHPQNKSMITLLNVPMVNLDSDQKGFFDPHDKIILVDTANIGPGSNQPYVSHNDVQVALVVDHHKGKPPEGAFVDNRKVGATASLIWDHLNSFNYTYSGEEGEVLATALALGVFTDTNMMTSDNITSLDFNAYQDLLGKVDRQKLVSLMEYPLPTYLFELRQRAFMDENKRIEESTIVSGIGVITPSKRDAIPIIADEFLRMSGITTSVVFAIIDNNIDISVRSKDITIDVSAFVQKIFGCGGAKQGSGGAQIPLGFYAMNGDKNLNNDLWEVTKRLVFNKVFSSIKGDE